MTKVSGANQEGVAARRLRKRLFPGGVLAVLLLASASAPAVFGQQYNIHHYDVSDGLPQNQGLSIHQGPQGYLWIGTYAGLSRYDGQRFRTFTTDDGLATNVVDAIASDAEGRIWVGTDGGACYLPAPTADRIHCLDQPESIADQAVQVVQVEGDQVWIGGENGLFRTPIDNPDAGEAVFDRAAVLSFLRGPDGNLWLGTDAGLYLAALRDTRFGRVSLPEEAGNAVNALVADDPRVWIGTDAGLYFVEDPRLQAAPVPDEARSLDVTSGLRDARGRVWFGTDAGVLRGDSEGLERHTRDSGLASAHVLSLFEDREGLVWLGLDDGLNKWVPGGFRGYTEDHGLIHPFARAVEQDPAHRVWLGTRAGAQIVAYVDGGWSMDGAETVTGADGLPDERVYAMGFPDDDRALLGTQAGLAEWREGEGVTTVYGADEGLPDPRVRAIRPDGDRTWIATRGGTRILKDGVLHPPPAESLQTASVFRIKRDANGRLWFATQEGGVIVHSGDGEVERLGAAEGLTDYLIWDLAPDPDGGMWVGSNGDGLFHVAADGEVERFSGAEGLGNDFVWHLVRNEQGDIWAYTNNGLFRWDGEDFRRYGLADGLLHLEGGATAGLAAHNGHLWFATSNGVMEYRPEEGFDNEVPPLVAIESATADGEAFSAEDILPADVGTVEFQLMASSFHNEDAVVFRYRLNGEDWSEPTGDRSITFAGLGGGDYRLEVEARNPHGVWSDSPASLSFQVAAPFWATWWFGFIAVMALLVLLAAAYRVRFQRLEARRRELARQVKERTAELEEANRHLKDMNERLEEASITDPLTGLRNRRFLVQQVDLDLALSQRLYADTEQSPGNRDIIFMMIDLDHFKQINDRYGHVAGDIVLRGYADLIRRQLRDSDYVVRWGGEEFLVVARQTDSAECRAIAERLIRKARETRFEVGETGDTVRCSCSIGISRYPFFPDSPEALGWEQIVSIADVAVYMAKAAGRDGWVSVYGAEGTVVRDAAAFTRRANHDLRSLIEEDCVVVHSSVEDVQEFAPPHREWREIF